MQTKTRSSLRVLSNGTTIKTTRSNDEKKYEWTEEGWNARKWNIKGEIVDYHKVSLDIFVFKERTAIVNTWNQSKYFLEIIKYPLQCFMFFQ